MKNPFQFGSFAALLGFSLFWCGITATVASITIAGLYRHEDARRRFKMADGTVISSEVSQSSSRKRGMLYEPKIRTRYTVGGKEYVTGRYSLERRNYSGGEARTRAIVQEFAPGKSVPIYYDPEMPEIGVLTLETPTGHWFILLFLQPFIVVGLGTLGGLFVYFPERRRLDRFLGQEPAFPWPIPAWGVLESSGGVLEIDFRPSLLLSVAGMYFGIAFLSSVAIAIFFSGFSDPPGVAVGVGFGASLAAAIVGGPLWAARRRSRLRLDPASRTIQLSGIGRERTIGLGEVGEFLLRCPVRKGRRGSYRAAPELRVRLRSGEEIVLHTFYTMDQSLAVARKSGDLLARSAALSLREE